MNLQSIKEHVVVTTSAGDNDNSNNNEYESKGNNNTCHNTEGCCTAIDIKSLDDILRDISVSGMCEGGDISVVLPDKQESCIGGLMTILFDTRQTQESHSPDRDEIEGDTLEREFYFCIAEKASDGNGKVQLTNFYKGVIRGSGVSTIADFSELVMSNFVQCVNHQGKRLGGGGGDGSTGDVFPMEGKEVVVSVRLDQWEAESMSKGQHGHLFLNGNTQPLIQVLDGSSGFDEIVDLYSLGAQNPFVVMLSDTIKQKKGILMYPNLRRYVPRVSVSTLKNTDTINGGGGGGGGSGKQEVQNTRKLDLIKKYENEALNTNNYMAMFPLITVLIVEDNIINRSILSGVLRKHKIQYKLAKNGKEAVDIWSKGGIHLIFMDLQLPVMSGIEAASRIRYLEKINGISSTTTSTSTSTSNSTSNSSSNNSASRTDGSGQEQGADRPLRRTAHDNHYSHREEHSGSVSSSSSSATLRTPTTQSYTAATSPSTPISTHISSASPSPNLAQECSEWVLDREKFKSPVIIVALTASNEQKDKENALMSGCNDYLTKPVNLVWLSNKLGEWGCMQALISYEKS